MKHLLALVFLFSSFTMFSQIEDIVGKWKTIDDKTGDAKSVVRIYKETNGKYYGVVEELFKNPDKKCENCSGENKGKPVLGMVIVTDMNEKNGSLGGGKILDPENGKTYFASISFDKKTGKLKLRGSLDKMGVAGRNQFWEKVQ